MNVERILELVDSIINTEKFTGFQGSLNELSTAMQQLSEQPHDVNRQKAVSDSLERLRSNLEQFEDRLSPPEKDFLDTIGSKKFFTNEIFGEINDSVSQNAMTPVTTRDLLQQLVVSRQEYLDNFDKLKKSLIFLNFHPYPLEKEEVEIGFELQRDIFGNSLQGFANELTNIDWIVKRVSKVVTGEAQHAELRQVSTTDPIIFIETYWPVAAAIAGSVTWALDTWERVDRIKKVRADAKEAGLKADDLKPFEAKIKDIIASAIKERIEEIQQDVSKAIAKKYDGDEESWLKWALEKILYNVERGMRVELRFLPPEQVVETDEETGEEVEVEIDKKEIERFEKLDLLKQRLKFPEISGKPMLSKPKEPKKGKAKTAPKKTTPKK